MDSTIIYGEAQSEGGSNKVIQAPQNDAEEPENKRKWWSTKQRQIDGTSLRDYLIPKQPASTWTQLSNAQQGTTLKHTIQSLSQEKTPNRHL